MAQPGRALQERGQRQGTAESCPGGGRFPAARPPSPARSSLTPPACEAWQKPLQRVHK